jgi:ABC-type polysaccharide/polyol phosphate transport system ATPase subunit
MSQNQEAIIKVQNLVKRFKYWPERPDNLKSLLIAWMKGKALRSSSIEVSVLEGLDFEVFPGEFVGIMGKNGAGKSTLMRLITGIYEPTSGKIEVNGRVAPLISLGAGFNPELSGYENIFLNAAILGFGYQRTHELLQSIIDFSELGDRIHMPIKNYSSGMVVRLGFSIAAHLDAPILLLDEVLGVGDQGFAKKSMNKIFELHRAGRTVVLVTHAAQIVADHCNRCIVISAGKKVFDGPAKEGAKVYSDLF